MNALIKPAQVALFVDCEPERRALRLVLDACMDLEVGPEVTQARSVTHLPDAAPPDVALVDMAGAHLMEACRRLHAAWPELPILALGSCPELASFALASGATRYEVRGARSVDLAVRDLLHSPARF